METAQESVRASAQVEGRSTEWLLTGCSVLAALVGFALAWLLYFKRRDLPELESYIG